MTRALIFDCDGVLADTERDGHLPAFNETFEHEGLPVRWSEDDYAEVLRIGGGRSASPPSSPRSSSGGPDCPRARRSSRR
ncbi:hypothetical protein Q0F99_12835 [Rathayibacter oskolensis]|uniref:hypothetical protein n=1 Tax=Rathayibacter oskolensis TaxID=1891671 RepID=UPI00265FC6B7|nr:hypothetical protein [Rathayibacter oskolensis]WKK70687.1 hypothetical protein Q0F99_12835 [Rathayibacter oskolensis]